VSRTFRSFVPLTSITLATTFAFASMATITACDNKAIDAGGDSTSTQVSRALNTDGRGVVADRFTAELWVVGNVAYTTTWGTRTTLDGVRSVGNAIKIWNIAGATPVLVDSVIVSDATTLGDIQATDDEKLLVVATEFSPGSVVVYNIANPLKPQLVSRFSNSNTMPGVHTATAAVVNGKLYAFLCVDPSGDQAARLVIVDLSNPAAPTEVFSQAMGNPFVHDVFVRDGILMVALWNDGMSIFDIGGGGAGGTVSNPKLLGNVKTVGGKVHNVWWFHDNANDTKRYAFVGEEGPGSIGSTSVGDIHIVDVSDLTKPHEVAFFNVPSAGTHNFSVDEDRGVLFAAYYNAGVRALNVRGDIGRCDATMKSEDGRCDLKKMGREVAHALTDAGMAVYVWGVFSVGTKLYASDMLNGLWRIDTLQ
jgi:LVIVD repeat-containing protein